MSQFGHFWSASGTLYKARSHQSETLYFKILIYWYSRHIVLAVYEWNHNHHNHLDMFLFFKKKKLLALHNSAWKIMIPFIHKWRIKVSCFVYCNGKRKSYSLVIIIKMNQNRSTIAQVHFWKYQWISFLKISWLIISTFYEFSFVQIYLGLTFKIITYQDLILHFQPNVTASLVSSLYNVKLLPYCLLNNIIFS